MGYVGLLCMCAVQSCDTPDQPLIWSILSRIFWRLLRIRIDPKAAKKPKATKKAKKATKKKASPKK